MLYWSIENKLMLMLDPMQLITALHFCSFRKKTTISSGFGHERIEQSFHRFGTLLRIPLLSIDIIHKGDSKSSLEAFGPFEAESC